MKINFILPRTNNKPMGGYKIVYQYAKRLADDGNDVHIYYLMQNKRMELSTILKKVQGLTFERGKYRNVNWFNLEGVKLHFDQTIDSVERISQGKIIATHWSTAKVVSESKCNDSDKFYFIQDYEIFDPMVTKDILDNTWKLPLKKIVVSKWLIQKGTEIGISLNDMLYLPNFVDTKEFKIEKTLNTERKYISFLWHSNPRKQAKLGIAVAKELIKKYPNLDAIMFGSNIVDHPQELKIAENADIEQLNNIYRKSIVYFMPSSKEGWGLTGMEAMACGAAVVSVDNGGIWEYADKDSAIIVENDKEKLVEAISILIDRPDYRKRIISRAYERIKNYTFDNSYQQLLKILDKN